jgi:hypothetical protein
MPAGKRPRQQHALDFARQTQLFVDPLPGELFLIKPRVFDRDRHLIGKQREKSHVFIGERFLRDFGAKQQHAGKLVVMVKRQQQLGLEAGQGFALLRLGEVRDNVFRIGRQFHAMRWALSSIRASRRVRVIFSCNCSRSISRANSRLSVCSNC